MKFNQGDKVKLCKRQTANVRRVLGQGQMPAGLFFSQDGQELFIAEEQVLQVAEYSDFDGQPLPRIAASVVNRDDLNERFSKVE